MDVYSPFHRAPWERDPYALVTDRASSSVVVEDDAIARYVETQLDSYRASIERFFPMAQQFLRRYQDYPVQSFVLRMGPRSFVFGQRKADGASTRVMTLHDFSPPVEQVNIFDIQARWQAPWMKFDATQRSSFTESDAIHDGTREALDDALMLFWSALGDEDFARVCLDLLLAEDFNTACTIPRGDAPLVAEVYLTEPAHFRRRERWGFQFLNGPNRRLDVNAVREIESTLETSAKTLDILCLVTSRDLTSIGGFVSADNPRFRIWDQAILRRLVDSHVDVIATHFNRYAPALKHLSTIQPIAVATSEASLLKSMLLTCPAGREAFSHYENVATDLLKFIFSGELTNPKTQRRTADGTQRRDTIFRNASQRRFWRRVAAAYGADLVIFDFKNYREMVQAEDIFDVARYAHHALGRFALIVTRNGAGTSVEAAQHRVYRDSGTIVLVITDSHLSEMADRRSSGKEPEALLEDLLDEFLIRT